MDREFLTGLFVDFGPVTIRRMFSGYGISVEGVNFALSLRAGLFFRADEETIPRFEAEGSKPFSYQTKTRSMTIASYWELPARLFDDTEELSEWARAALGAAQRAALKKRTRSRKPRSKAGSAEAEKAPAKTRKAVSAKTAAGKAAVSKAKKATKPSPRGGKKPKSKARAKTGRAR